jgi:hypothetical protein
VNSKADRDSAIDEMLRTTLRAEAARATVSDECLDAETIAAWSDGALPAASAARIETHLSQCSHCQALVAVLVRATPSTPASRSIWQRWQLRWVVPIAAAASALALWIAVPTDKREVAPRPATLDDARQSAAPSSPAPPSGVAEQERNAVSPNLEKRADQFASQATTPTAPSPAADSAAAAGAPPVRNQSAAKAESPQENAPAPLAAPAAPPPLRRELSAEQRTPAAIEAQSPDPTNRWRIVNGTRIERSTDSGISWQALVFPEATELTAIRALSATAAIVTTADNRQFRTDDAGKTWTPVAP